MAAGMTPACGHGRFCHGFVTKGLTTVTGLAVLLGATACTPAPTREGEPLRVEKREGMPTSAAEVALPPGAIKVSERLYMVPIGIDVDGCEQFSAYPADGGMTKQAIHYRRPDGSFSLDKDSATCRVEVVALGPDAAGCAQFRAEPAAGLAPTGVTYYQAKAGGYVARKPEAGCQP